MGKHLQDKHDAERSRQTLNLNMMKQTLPDELTGFPLTNIPFPRKAGLSFSAVLLCFSTLPLASVLCGQHTLWTLPLLAVLLGHLSSSAFGSNDSGWCLSCQVELTLCGPLFVGPHCCPHRCPYRTLINSCERLPILPHRKGRPERLLRASVQRSRNQPNNTRLFNGSNSFSSAPPPPLPSREN